MKTVFIWAEFLMVECSCIMQVNILHKNYGTSRISMSDIHWYVILNYISGAEMSDIIASIAPISGSPFLGFDHIPHSPVSVIDFHGTDDDTIPYDLNR